MSLSVSLWRQHCSCHCVLVLDSYEVIVFCLEMFSGIPPLETVTNMCSMSFRPSEQVWHSHLQIAVKPD